ncbi:carbohydrate esterase family 12 protein [Rhexocercosporidium sp. MPI-PUGE-AT-0058]|nr:carbohydrate esterase family 12 protein [Rhexocercosporidium sp. MPI-PUGE-AT-0058]
MKYFYITIPALLATLASAAPAEEIEERANPTIYMAGDSTMALGGGGSGTNGWGVYFPFSVKNANIVNAAIGGRSARSYTDEGRFTSLVNKVVSGDYVIIEFGHNDGGSLATSDNGRTDCFGSGSETCTTPAGVVVQTYVTYLTNAAKALIAKGAKVIISSPTPNNICEGSSCSYTPPRFTAYGRQVVQNAGSGASFIDHGQYLANEYIRLGKAKTDTFYPVDHTHTSPAGANVVAQTFVKAVLCGNGVLAPFIKNGTSSVAGNCA